MHQKKFWVAGIVVGLALATLTYNAVSGSSVYYYEVGELKSRASTLQGQEVRVDGKVMAPIAWDAMTRTTRFTLMDKDGGQTLPVIFRGTVPDTFKADAEVVVKGRYTAEGVFEGNELQARCASKYTPRL